MFLDISNQELLDKLYDHNNAKGDYKVVANIPYTITSPILRKFTEQVPTPSLAILLIQKEVAERIAAKPGDLSILGIAVQFYADVEISLNDSRNPPQHILIDLDTYVNNVVLKFGHHKVLK